jgi:nucleoside-diphosphate-sugar epimerase
MLIGNGTIAGSFREFESNNDFAIFAAGVSNSKASLAHEFERESNLLEKTIEEYAHLMHFIYFSTCSIYDPSESASAYVLHKLDMEKLIKNRCSNYHIFRVSNVVSNTKNKVTIFHFLINNRFNLWVGANRNILDLGDMAQAIRHILLNKLFQNQTINIANPKNYSIKYIVSEMEQFLNCSAVYDEVDRGANFVIDTKIITDIYSQLGINFDETYLFRLLSKYYSNYRII